MPPAKENNGIIISSPLTRLLPGRGGCPGPYELGLKWEAQGDGFGNFLGSPHRRPTHFLLRSDSAKPRLRGLRQEKPGG